MQYRTVLTIFPFILQKIIIAQVLYTGGHRCNKRLQTFYKKNNNKQVFNVFFNFNVFKNFQQLKSAKITFPDFSNIGKVLTIKNNGI